MKALLFKAHDGQVVKLDAVVVDDLRKFEQRGALTEAGGVLLGRCIVSTLALIVDCISQPMLGDRRSRFSFFRARSPHQQFIDAMHRASGGTCGYLGEWHTHPEPDPTPSYTDLQDWKRRLRRDQVDIDAALFAIVGTEAIGLWRGRRTTGAIERMTLFDVLDIEASARTAALAREGKRQ